MSIRPPFVLRHHRWLAALVLSALAAPPAAAQRIAHADAAWTVRSNAAVDLWFHGLAVIGLRGPGPLPFYSDAYARSVGADKRARGIAPTRLERDAPRFRAAFARDSAFEILHFLPLYLATDDPRRLLAMLSPVTTGAARSGDPALDAVASVLVTPSQRAVLADFLAALDEEWTVYLRDASARDADARATRRAWLTTLWSTRFVPPLSEYLHGEGLASGTILVVPALGLEGRIVRLEEAGHVIVVVPSGAPDMASAAPLLSAVRELCFPAVERGLAERAWTSQPRLVAIDLTSRAAVRCGAQLLAERAPSLGSDYRRLYVPRSDSTSDEVLRRRFDTRFQLPSWAEQALRTELARAMPAVRGRPQ